MTLDRKVWKHFPIPNCNSWPACRRLISWIASRGEVSSKAQSCSQELSPLRPCWKYKRADQGKWKASTVHSRSITWALPGTGTDAGAEHSPSLQYNVQSTSGDREVWKASQLRGEIRLRSPSSTASWPGLSSNSWATEKELRWSWSARKSHRSLLFL